MSELNKEQIQTEYSKTVALLGDKVYRLFLPLLECFEFCQRLLSLNKDMHKLMQAEKKDEKAA